MPNLLDPTRFAADALRARSWRRNDEASRTLRLIREDALEGLVGAGEEWSRIYSALRPLGHDEIVAFVRSFAAADAEPTGWACEAADAIEARFLELSEAAANSNA